MSAPAAALRPDYNLADQERMRRARHYFAWQYRLAAPYLGRKVIEIGCGIGNFTCWLRDRDSVIAVDADPLCLGRLEARWAGDAALRTMAAEAGHGRLLALAPSGADSCVALNVLEHIADDRLALEEMAALVRPGGRVILLVPAFPALYGATDQALGHFRRYRRSGLVALAGHAGLQVERLQHINCLGFVAWWVNARLGRAEQSPRQIALFDRLAPALERLDCFSAPVLPFGLSLFAVLRRLA